MALAKRPAHPSGLGPVLPYDGEGRIFRSIPASEHHLYGGDACLDEADGCCAKCGVSLGDPCTACGGVGYHRDGCARIDG